MLDARIHSKPTTFELSLRKNLGELSAKGLLRTLTLYEGEDFISNDYLGFSRDHSLRERLIARLSQGMDTGAAGSRLLGGERPEYAEAEAAFRAFIDAEAVLLFQSGFMANFAVLTTLPTRNDLILLDEEIHASLRTGARASFAERRTFRHNDTLDLERLLLSPRKGEVFVVVESLYSMGGDESPLDVIVPLCERHGAILIVDEAHALGVFGQGRGLLHEYQLADHVPITIYPCGKAMGATGAFVAGSEALIKSLLNRAVPFIFTTALTPYVPAMLTEVTRCIADSPTLGEELLAKSIHFRGALQRRLKRWIVPRGRSPIVPLIIGNTEETMSAAEQLRLRGFAVAGVRPPTVAAGGERIRLILKHYHTPMVLEKLANAVIEIEEDLS